MIFSSVELVRWRIYLVAVGENDGESCLGRLSPALKVRWRWRNIPESCNFSVCRLDNIILLLRKVTCNTFSLIALFLNLSLFHYPLIVFIYFQECLVINSKTIHHSIQSLKHFPLTTTRSQGVYSNETIKEGISRATTKPRLSFANVYGRIKISFNWIAWWRVSLAITLRGLGPCYVLYSADVEVDDDDDDGDDSAGYIPNPQFIANPIYSSCVAPTTFIRRLPELDLLVCWS